MATTTSTRATALTEQIQLLTRSMHVLRNNIAAADGEHLPWPTYMLLFHLIAGGPRRAGALAEIACIDPSTVSRQVDTLVRLGLVERQADPDDGRATVLVPTEEGIAMQERMRGVRDAMMADVLSDWSDEDVSTLAALLTRFNTSLSAQLPQIVGAVPRRVSAAPAAGPDGTTNTEDHA